MKRSELREAIENAMNDKTVGNYSAYREVRKRVPDLIDEIKYGTYHATSDRDS